MNPKTKKLLLLVILLLLLSVFLLILVTQKRERENAAGLNSTGSETSVETSAEISVENTDPIGSESADVSDSSGAETSMESTSEEETASQAESSDSSSSAESSETSASSETSESSGAGGSSGNESSSNSSISEEDLPDKPDPQFETSEAYFDDINVKVLTAVLSRDFDTLSGYVGDAGLRLCPMGEPGVEDITLSASEVSGFFSRGSEMYGIYPGSGNPIRMMPDEYYQTFINPDSFDFTSCTTLYDDADDLSAASAFGSDLHTVGYHYAPNIMEWQNVIFVYQRDGERDLLVGIIYQDMTTN